MFLPTLEDSDMPNKKTKSAIFLLTPNRNSSIQLMNHPLMVNMKSPSLELREVAVVSLICSLLHEADDMVVPECLDVALEGVEVGVGPEVVREVGHIVPDVQLL